MMCYNEKQVCESRYLIVYLVALRCSAPTVLLAAIFKIYFAVIQICLDSFCKIYSTADQYVLMIHVI